MTAKQTTKCTNAVASHQTITHAQNKQRGLTLIELIVVIILIALLLSLLAPALQAARKLSRTDVCLDNLRAQGQAISIYARTYGTLPGPLHPAIYRDQTTETWEEFGWTSDRIPGFIALQFVTVMSREIDSSYIERIVSCPTMQGVVPRSHFRDYGETTGSLTLPFHYGLNTWYHATSDSTTRETDPVAYFGCVAADTVLAPPRSIAGIPNASREWMTADAWYRPRANVSVPFLQQEGPFQTAYSGAPLPNFAPHLRRAGTVYAFTTSENRDIESSLIRLNKSDGATNTVFFDGHAETVPSRIAEINGFELLYGFPGTVNPTLETTQHQNIWNMLHWY